MTAHIKDGWFTEYFLNQSIGQTYKIKSILHQEKSEFQEITVLDTYALGRLLLLDGKTMVSDLDEFVYHEIMGHIPTMVHPNPLKVLVIGGGDGGIVRELVKHPNLEEIHLVEIDRRVIEVSQEFFPHCTSGLTDPRVKILPEDGIEFVKRHKNTYDIVIVDSTDPEDFAEGLFTEQFYKTVYDSLKETGIMMNQTENPFFDMYNLQTIYTNMQKSFTSVTSLSAPMIIYPGVYWTFSFAAKGKLVSTELFEPRIPWMKELQKSLKWYNMDWHRGAFKVANLHKNKIGQNNV